MNVFLTKTLVSVVFYKVKKQNKIACLKKFRKLFASIRQITEDTNNIPKILSNEHLKKKEASFTL